MALILDGTTGASAVQDSSVTDGKLSLTANSAQIKTALNANNGAPIYACRAWVNFNGTGTVAIRASGNVSSITDNGTGDYTVNFTTAMSDANYSSVVSISIDVGFTPQIPMTNSKSTGGYANVAPTSSAFRFFCGRATDGAAVDELYVHVSFFR